jgi:3-methyladenine DNA glycosylase AlkD
MSALDSLQRELRGLADPEKAKVLGRFFKTGPGEYGEGDKFLGVMVPQSRKVASRHFRRISLAEVGALLKSPFHEERLVALLVLVLKFQKGDDREKAAVYRHYCRCTRWINNWDLVDTSAAYIVGPYLETRSRAPLYKWARSRSVWERRIAVLSTFHFIRGGEFGDFLALAEKLLGDDHDLIHKAVGWMLREVGRRDRAAEVAFLKRHHKKMPRTMLRYAIEHFPARDKKKFMAR